MLRCISIRNELKLQITFNSIKWKKTVAELAYEYCVHANQISKWKKHLLDAVPDAFTSVKDKGAEKKEIE